MMKKLLEHLILKKGLQKANLTKFRTEKLKEKVINYMSNGQVVIVHLIVELIKKILLYKVSYFAEPTHSKNKIKIDLNLFSYETKSDLKNETGVETSKFAKTANLATIMVIYFETS